MMPAFDVSTIRRLARPVPRYTSYPTAPHFHEGVDGGVYAGWLQALPHHVPLSLYVHVPFCDRLCWFCGCHTKQTLRYEPIAAYLTMVRQEMALVADRLGGRGAAVALHLGGGSPSMLKAADLVALADELRRRFAAAPELEFSIEIDPNDMGIEQYDAFAAAGVNRISIGVQDFDARVQAAINRMQSFEQTADVVLGMRARGVTSTNLDVLYGLPYQSVESVVRTVDLALSLRPERLALFGYAHVPWMKTHQKMIDETALPDAVARFEQSQAAAARIVAAGYVAIGIDHFALPGDGLAVAARRGRLHRNFQGYTTDDAPALIGLGASSIGSLPQGHVQNIAPTGTYMKAVAEGILPVARGVVLNEDDRLRGWVIERLMCDFAVSVEAMRLRFGGGAAMVAAMAEAARDDADGLVAFDGRQFSLTARGRPFVRSVAARFDAYLGGGAARHSLAV